MGGDVETCAMASEFESGVGDAIDSRRLEFLGDKELK